MVTPGKLRQSLAEALALQDHLERIDVHLRNLREAGLIAKAKRGRGAAEMGPTDAAHLLLAVAGSELVKDSVRTVEQYGELRADPASVSVRGNYERGRYRLALLDLPPKHTVVEALSQIFSLLASNVFFADVRYELERRYGSRPSEQAEYIFLRLFRPYQAASIHYGVRRRLDVQVVYGSLPIRDPRVAWDLRNLETAGQLLTVRVVDQAALSKIAHVVG